MVKLGIISTIICIAILSIWFMSDLLYEIHIFNSPNNVWKYWTSSDLITKWFPPEANIEPKLHGAFELQCNSKPGETAVHHK